MFIYRDSLNNGKVFLHLCLCCGEYSDFVILYVNSRVKIHVGIHTWMIFFPFSFIVIMMSTCIDLLFSFNFKIH